METSNGTIGDRLVKLRKENNFTQKQIAEYLGFKQSQIAKLESNQRKLKVYSLEKLCDLYLCTDDYILYGKGEYSKSKFEFNKKDNNISLQTIGELNRIITNLEFLDKLEKAN